MTKNLITTLKVGDKIICNKSYSVKVEYERIIEYNTGDVYTLTIIYELDKWYPYPIHGKNSIDMEHGFSTKELETNWITLAEWREQQIDKILEDDI